MLESQGMLGTPICRAIEGMHESSGRTLVIAGPADSGKSDLLRDVRAELDSQHISVRAIEGSYRERGRPFAALANLFENSPGSVVGLPGAEGNEAEGADLASPLLTEDTPRGRRTRGERHHLSIPALGFISRPRPAEFVDPRALLESLTAPSADGLVPPTAILVEDGSFVDSESRDVLLYLSDRARLHPLLLVIVLDTSLPAFVGWEERLVGRGDVDWVRLAQSKADPRDAARFRERFDQLPETSRRLLGYVALVGGVMTDTYLSHAAKVNSRMLSSIVGPAVDAGLVKIEGHQFVLSRPVGPQTIPELIPPEVRSTMHREIADAIRAMNPEPEVRRRIELAEHFFEAHHGPEALRYLVEAAYVTERLNDFDTAEALVAKGLQCLDSTSSALRDSTEANLDLRRARLLLFCGRPREAESALESGISFAFRDDPRHDAVVEEVELLYPCLRMAGPRPSLLTLLGKVTEQCREAGAPELRVLFLSVLAELSSSAGGREEGRHDVEEARQVAQTLEGSFMPSLVELSGAAIDLDGGSSPGASSAAMLLDIARGLETTRRPGFLLRAHDLRGRLETNRSNFRAAAEIHERATQDAFRQHALVYELDHQLGLAEALSELERGEPRVARATKRAGELVERLHLLPPAPSLLRLWLVDGRRRFQADDPEGARERWRAVADLPAHLAPPRLRAEALLRLIVVEGRLKSWSALRRHLDRLGEPDIESGLKPKWRGWVQQARGQLSKALEGIPDLTPDPLGITH
ncbi:MAG: ATP-binding protein [Thermoplasmata archaeon]